MHNLPGLDTQVWNEFSSILIGQLLTENHCVVHTNVRAVLSQLQDTRIFGKVL